MDQAEAGIVMDRSEILAGFSEEPGRLTRRFASSAMRQAHEAVRTWACAAGMVTRRIARVRKP